MNFYKRHLGDYAKDAGHLSMLEHGAYTLLLDRIYTTEQPIEQADAYRVCRARSREERAAVDAVLREFFTTDGGAWMNRRAAEEIAKASRQRDVNREIGKRGGRPRQTDSEAERQTESVHDRITESVPVRNPTPDSRLQTPDSTSGSESPQLLLPSVGGGGLAPPGAAPPTPPPAFDGLNAEALNGKAVVPIALGFQLPADWGQDALALGFKAADTLREGERFRQYWTVGKGAGTRRSVKGWRQSWSNWLGKAARDAR